MIIPLEGLVLDGFYVTLIGECRLTCSKEYTTFRFSFLDIQTDSSTKRVTAGNRQDWPAIMNLVGSTVARCEIASDTGILTLELNNNTKLIIPPDADYEHWEINIFGDKEYLIFSLPGEGYDWSCGSDLKLVS
jgi:hypothetical protein